MKSDFCCYVVPIQSGIPVTLVVPTKSQMRWIGYALYACAVTETGCDTVKQYIETLISSLVTHKFQHLMRVNPGLTRLPNEEDVGF